ncbi:helix-turn-helix domain-containing protein [Sphaerisporangium sp. NPDC051011]|uniref:TetR/AcrR family transcriptional regulator n=1 Tax=Sphaerisporangium sp. NPDC051011 TaxID=3155792 RepID=UPI0033EE4BEC
MTSEADTFDGGEQREATKRRDRRGQVVTAAASLFRQRGYAQVSIDDIGAAVGFSGPAVYRYFPGKHHLLEAVAGSYLDVFAQRRQEGADGRPLDAVSALVTAGLRTPDALVVYSRQAHHLPEEGLTRLRRRRTELGLDSTDLIPAAGFTSQESGGDADLRSRCVAGAVTHAALARPGTLPLKTRLLTDVVGALKAAPLASHNPTFDQNRLPESPRFVHITRREAVLAAATELMAERGFVAVSLADIGSRVGITASAVTRHFDGKEALLAAVVNRVGEQISAGLAAALRDSQDARHAVRRIVEMYASLAVVHRDVVVIQTTESASLPQSHQLERRRRQRMYVDELARLIGLAAPHRSAVECRLRAGMVFALTNEAAISPAIARRDGVAEDLTTLGLAAAGA